MTKEQRMIKQRDKISDIENSIKKLPYEICYYTEVILKAGLIEVTDTSLPCFDAFLRRAEKCPSKKVLSKVMSFNIGRILEIEWKDQYGLHIVEKYKYFCRCIIHGFRREGMSDEFIDSLFIDEEEK